MTPGYFKDIWIDAPGGIVRNLRCTVSKILVWYFWLSAAVVLGACYWTGGQCLVVGASLALIGLITTLAAHSDPASLSTRLTVTIAINSTWMFGLYIVSDIHNGEYMLEVHMLYFINTSIILSYVCWRSVVLTTVAALAHHLILTLVQPELVWPSSSYSWWHFMNHSLLGTVNCFGGIYIAVTLKNFLDRMENSKIEAQHRSIHDDLTGVLNRRGLRQAVQTIQGTDGGKTDISFLQIDLDGFKAINDTAGHAAGDELLVLVADRLTKLAPRNSVVARIGGDEFVVVIASMDADEIEKFVTGMEQWMLHPHRAAGHKIRVSASTGVTNTSLSGGRLDDLMIDADFALYEAKRAGKNRSVMFSPALKVRAQQRKQTADEVLRGLEEGEFEPFFQTQHDARTGVIVGVEVLARWRHPERGLLAPGEFLQAVNEANRVAALDKFILERALEIVQSFEKAGLKFPKVSFNVSYQRLCEPGLVDSLRTLPGIEADIAFELVESVFFDGLSNEEVATVRALRDRGVRIEIDDFGTGHASVIALTKLQPDLLKIDRDLISPISDQPEQLKIIKSIVDMARSLGIETLAEGVETEFEMNKLRMIGVNAFQGYALCKPMSADSLRQYLMQATA